jgi:hypothetical protein
VLTEQRLRQIGARQWQELYSGLAAGLHRTTSAESLEEQLGAMAARLGAYRSLDVRSLDRDQNGFPTLLVKAAVERGAADGSFTWVPCGDTWRLLAFNLERSPATTPPQGPGG